MNLRERWQNNDTFRRSVIGAIAGASAGITAVNIPSGSLIERYGIAIFVGLVVFVALKLLID